MKTVRVLQLGEENFIEKYPVSEEADWYYEPDLDEDTEIFDLVIIDRPLGMYESKFITALSKAYCVFFTEKVTLNVGTHLLLRFKNGRIIDENQLKKLLLDELPLYFPKPYGEKYDFKNMGVSSGFKGNVNWCGNTKVEFEGCFGEEFRQIVYWRNNIPIEKNQAIDLWLEYEKSENVEIKLKVVQFDARSVCDIQNEWIFDENDMKDIVFIENKKEAGPIFVSVLAKGSGKLGIIALHDRYSRKNLGAFLPGGQRYFTSKREEVFCYFDPGDLKPPLNVYFSGYKTQEGFEGYNMMKSLGSPFLLISDARLEGGSFYVGDEEYENLVRALILGHAKELGFRSEQIIMAGLSMGTFGAAYYGCDIVPGAIVLGKPLFSIGDVAKNEKILRPTGFPTSLDLIWKEYGSCGKASIVKMNNRFWDKFKNTNWKNTKFAVAYMYEDDYDSGAYKRVLNMLMNEGVQIYGKGLHGRHNDDTAGVVTWFISQIKKIMMDEFDRDFK